MIVAPDWDCALLWKFDYEQLVPATSNWNKGQQEELNLRKFMQRLKEGLSPSHDRPTTIDPIPAFNAFGKAVASIAACEQIMRIALLDAEFAKANRAGNAGPERFQAYINRMQRWDFGQLSQRVRGAYKLPDDPWVAIFKDAKDMRNNVAHDFWTPYYSFLRDPRGIDLIIRHCKAIEAHIAHLTEGIIHMNCANVALYLEMLNDPQGRAEKLDGLEEIIIRWEGDIAQFVPWDYEPDAAQLASIPSVKMT